MLHPAPDRDRLEDEPPRRQPPAPVVANVDARDNLDLVPTIAQAGDEPMQEDRVAGGSGVEIRGSGNVQGDLQTPTSARVGTRSSSAGMRWMHARRRIASFRQRSSRAWSSETASYPASSAS